MGTRCNIQIHSITDCGTFEGPMLYQHCDGQPTRMRAVFASIVRKINEITPRTTDAEMVAGILVVDSVLDGEPTIVPACQRHEDTCFDYHVYVSESDFSVDCSGDEDHSWSFERILPATG